jgi:hypothetical protein
VLVKVKKLWERYKERAIIMLILPAFLHNSLSYEISELDAFDCIVLSFTAVA